MRILHLSTFLQGGAGRAITDLALAQHAQGHVVSVAIDAEEEPGYQSYPEYIERLGRTGVPVHRIQSTFKRDLVRNVAAVRQLRSIPDLDRTDLVHAHAAIPALIGRLMSSPSGRAVPVVQTMHGWGVSKTDEQAATDVAIMNLLDAVVMPSRTAAEQMRVLGVDGDLTSVVPYGIHEETAASLSGADAILLDDLRRRWTLVLGCVGTIGERKNQRLVIDALAQVRSAVVGCVFIGDGDAAGLTAYARSRGVADRTVVLGYRAAASQYLRKTDACVLASRNEGQPLTILEAFRDGVPVLAADIDELRELVEHRVTGWLFAQEDASSLAAAIESAARGTTRTFAKKARAVYESRFSVTHMVAGYAAVYSRAFERRVAQAGAALL